MRIEMRALAINKRSIDAIRRLKMPVAGARVAVAVLDIWVPFLEGSERLRDDLGTV